MRNLRTVSLAIAMAFAVAPAFAATPTKASLATGESAALASALNGIFAPASSTPPISLSSPSRPPFYGWCSQDCTPCYSGNPYPQCPPDIFEGNGQSCLPFQGC